VYRSSRNQKEILLEMIVVVIFQIEGDDWIKWLSCIIFCENHSQTISTWLKDNKSLNFHSFYLGDFFKMLIESEKSLLNTFSWWKKEHYFYFTCYFFQNNSVNLFYKDRSNRWLNYQTETIDHVSRVNNLDQILVRLTKLDTSTVFFFFLHILIKNHSKKWFNKSPELLFSCILWMIYKKGALLVHNLMSTTWIMVFCIDFFLSLTSCQEKKGVWRKEKKKVSEEKKKKGVKTTLCEIYTCTHILQYMLYSITTSVTHLELRTYKFTHSINRYYSFYSTIIF
jgi:hypothetical protein